MQPRYYQQEAHDATWNFLRDKSGNPVIVIPTGGGKSLIAAMLVRKALEFNARVIVLQHRKELIEQNAEKVKILLPDEEIGLNSAGLRRSAFDEDVICAGIQSVYKKAHEFGRRELIIIDEVHLVGGDETMYGKFLSDIKEINPNARFVGMSATPYRTGEGPICGSDKLFQRICYEAQTGTLISEGYLCPITNRAAESQIDTSAIKQRGGEFIHGDAERAFNTDDNVAAACRETVRKCHDRGSVLVFAAGVQHAEHIVDELEQLTGERVGLVTGDTLDIERQAYLHDFKNQDLRWLVNCDVLTTGFDAPCIDAIAVMRATMSPGLFAQIVGRGLRKHDSKTECLILDFGENIKRHGSLDDPNYGRASVVHRGDGKGERAENGRGKLCFNCEMDVASNARECPECGFVFPVNHDSRSDDESQITGVEPPKEWIVESCWWSKHEKKNDTNALPTLRVNYTCQPMDADETGNLTGESISEWVCIEHDGFALQKARQWWQARSIADVPDSVDDALKLIDASAVRMPHTITTIKEGRYYRIKEVSFREEIPEEWEEVSEQFDFESDEVPF